VAVVTDAEAAAMVVEAAATAAVTVVEAAAIAVATTITAAATTVRHADVSVQEKRRERRERMPERH